MKLLTGLIVGLICIIALFAFIFISQKSTEIRTDTEHQVSSSQTPRYQSIKYEGVDLIDSTIYDQANNICYGERNGMRIEINPCVAQDIDGVNIKQDVNFTWNGENAQNVGWIFVYDGEIESGSISVLSNVSYQETRSKIINSWVNNYLVSGVSSYTDLGTPDLRCQIGNTNNTQMFSVAHSDTAGNYNRTYCFTNVTVVNATAFRISGNYDMEQDYQVTQYKMDYLDVTNQIQFLGNGLLNDSRSYYRIESSTFQQGQSRYTKWVYTPKNALKSGKWHILGYNADIGVVPSLRQDQYIYIDPWWNSTWTYKKVVGLNNIGTSGAINSSVYIIVDKVAGMNETGKDLRFVNSSETGELKHWIRLVNSTTFGVYVLLTERGNITMYYGNNLATSTSDYNALVTKFGHGKTLSSSAGGEPTFWGQTITAIQNFTLIGATAYSGCDAGQVYINNGSAPMFNFSLVNEFANITNNWVAVAYTNYSFTMGTAGGSYTQKYANIGGFPVTGTIFKYLSDAQSYFINTDLNYWRNTKDFDVIPMINNVTTYSFGSEEAGSSSPSLSLNFTTPTPPNATVLYVNSTTINATIDGSMKEIFFNWNGTNYTLYDDNTLFKANFENLSALGESDATVKDTSKYGHNATVTSATWTSSGKYGGAYTFDGINDFMSLGDNIRFSPYRDGTVDSGLTISLWFKANTLTGTKHLVGKMNGEYVIYQNNQNVVWDTWEPATSVGYYRVTASNVVTATDTWIHAVGVLNYKADGTGNATLYINGVYSGVDTTNATAAMNDTGVPVRIGSGNGFYWFNGTIDDVQIWNRTLTSGEISQLYKSNIQKYNATHWTYLSTQVNTNAASMTYHLGAKNQTDGVFYTDTRTVTFKGSYTPLALHLSWINRTQTNTTMMISWKELINDSTSIVRYSSTNNNCTNLTSNVTAQTIDMANTTHFMKHGQVTGLNPNTTYYFCIENTQGISSVYNFRTAPSTGNNFTFIVGSDVQGSLTPFRALANLSLVYDPLFFMFPGDMVETGGNDTLWVEFFNASQTSLITSTNRLIPFIPALGNHETVEDAQTILWHEYFNIPQIESERYSYHDVGDVRIISLNTLTNITDQVTFLNSTLNTSNSSGKWIITQGHYNFYPIRYGVDATTLSMRNNWGSLFDLYHTQVHFEGHEHKYKRTYPMLNNQSVAAGLGTVYISTVGGFSKGDVNSSNFWSMAVYNNGSNALAIAKFTDNVTLNITVLNDSGRVLDSTLIPKTYVPDVTPPSVSIISPANTTYITRNLLVNISNSSDAANTWWYNGTTNVTYTVPVYFNFTEGSNTIYAYANDSSGNLNTTSVTFSIDSIVPTISIIYPTATSYSANVTALNYTVSDTNLQVCKFSNNSGVSNTTITCGANMTGLNASEGSNTWTIYANDSFGNANSASVTFTQSTSIPVITIASPTSRNYSTTSILLSFSASKNLTNSWYTINGGTTNTTFTNGTTITANEGYNTVVIYGNDTLGLIGSNSVAFGVDTTDPSVSITYPTATSYTSTVTRLNYTASDTNLQVCKYSTDSGVTNTTITCGTNVTGLSATYGSYTWTVYVNDSVGHTASSSVTFTVPDSVYPSFSAYWDNNGTANATTAALFNVTVANTNGTVYLTINGQNYLARNTTAATVFNTSVLLTTGGVYSYSWTAYGSGVDHNTNTSSTRYITINSTVITINPLYSPLDVESIMILDLAGDLNIFAFIALMIFSFALAKFDIPAKITWALFALFAIIFGAVYDSFLVVGITILGLVIFYSIGRIGK